jgi:glycosyltransferase involved in cell wall biosynthesis
MKILRIIATIDPATGGPVSGLRAVTPALAKLGHESEFLTVDEPLAGYIQSFVGPVHALGPAKSSYCYSPRVRHWLDRNARNYDAIIVHGLWQYFGPTVRAVSQTPGNPPYFVFPHGMLDPSLRRTYPGKHVKKWLYWVLTEHRVLRDARAVFFTCEEERRLARTTFPMYHCNERVVAYGTTRPDGDAAHWRKAWEQRCPAVAGKPYLVFLGRIHSKKGVDILLRAYGHVTQEARRVTTRTVPDLVLAGPCLDQSYLNQLQEIASELNIADRIHWTGMLTGDAKWGALAGAEAFILPSHQENFGIAVVEALACGTPVLLSDRVNIWREIVDSNAALVEAPTEVGVARLLERWMNLDRPAREAMSTAARASYSRSFEVTHVADSLANQLDELIKNKA